MFAHHCITHSEVHGKQKLRRTWLEWTTYLECMFVLLLSVEHSSRRSYQPYTHRQTNVASETQLHIKPGTHWRQSWIPPCHFGNKVKRTFDISATESIVSATNSTVLATESTEFATVSTTTCCWIQVVAKTGDKVDSIGDSRLCRRCERGLTDDFVRLSISKAVSPQHAKTCLNFSTWLWF